MVVLAVPVTSLPVEIRDVSDLLRVLQVFQNATKLITALAITAINETHYWIVLVKMLINKHYRWPYH